MSMTFEQAVKSLGETPEEVLLALREKGVKGYRRMAGSCPVAKYLNACGFPNVTVCTSAKCYRDGSKEADSEQSIYLPSGVQKWICDFDDGKYPEFYLVD